MDLVGPETYWELTAEELDGISRWLLAHWTDRPPSFASDGVDFYSLRDSIGLLASTLNNFQLLGAFPSTQQLTFFYGPLDEVGLYTEVRLTDADVYTIAKSIAQTMNSPDDSWETVPPNIFPSVFQTSRGKINTAQALYAMATLYASTYAGVPESSIAVPASELVPETSLFLEELGCWTCIDSAWSLKPATIHLDE